MKHYNETLSRIQAINFCASTGATIDPEQGIREHFRRIALWYRELPASHPYWYFVHLARHFAPDLVLPDLSILDKYGFLKVDGVNAPTTLLLHQTLEWAWLMDVYPEILQLYDYLPHPYSAALRVFEEGWRLLQRNDGPEQFALTGVHENCGLTLSSTFSLGDVNEYLSLHPYTFPV